MKISYDDDFLESAVFLCASGESAPALQIARYHRQRERLYSVLDPDERNTAFFKLNVEWFREWGLESRLTYLLEEYPLLREKLALLVFRKSRGKNDEGAELYVQSSGQRNGVLALNVQILFNPGTLNALVRHELLHLHDMVDPQFGYEPDLPAQVRMPQQQRLAIERYRLLWDVSIDGRLSATGKPPLGEREQHWSAFTRAFAFWPELKQREVFQELWTDPSPSHARLASIVSDPRELHSTSAPGSGASCPLCGFPTFDWATQELLETAQAAIKVEFPHWSREHGACGRCVKIYTLRASQKLALA